MVFRPFWTEQAISHPIIIQNMRFRRLNFFWWRIPIPKTIIANAGASNWRCLGGVGTGGSEVRDNKQTAIYVKWSKNILVVEEFQHQSRYFLNLMSFRGLLHQLASLLQEGDKRTLLTRLKLKANYFPSHFVPCSDFTSYCWRIGFLLNCLSFMDKMAFYLNYSTKSGEYKRL